MALDGIMVLKLFQEFANEQLLNIFTYQADVGMAAINVRTAFLEDTLPAIRGSQCSQIVTKRIVTQNLGDVGDNDDHDMSLAGAITGDQMLPIFNAIGYTLRPANRVVRPGSKRFAGVSETAQQDGTIVEGGWITAVEATRLALDTPISDDDTLFAYPIVVKRVKYEVPDSDPVRFAYRFPESDLELVFSTLSGVKSSLRITHQVSRGNNR